MGTIQRISFFVFTSSVGTNKAPTVTKSQFDELHNVEKKKGNCVLEINIEDIDGENPVHVSPATIVVMTTPAPKEDIVHAVVRDIGGSSVKDNNSSFHHSTATYVNNSRLQHFPDPPTRSSSSSSSSSNHFNDCTNKNTYQYIKNSNNYARSNGTSMINPHDHKPGDNDTIMVQVEVLQEDGSTQIVQIPLSTSVINEAATLQRQIEEPPSPEMEKTLKEKLKSLTYLIPTFATKFVDTDYFKSKYTSTSDTEFIFFSEPIRQALNWWITILHDILNTTLPHIVTISIGIIAVLTCLGAYTFWKICTRKKCECKLCQGAYRHTNVIVGKGGFGTVHLVKKGRVKLVAKKIAVDDFTMLDEYQKEAKELVTLEHKNIISYVDDFVHVEFYSGWITNRTPFSKLNQKNFCILVLEFCPEGDLAQQMKLNYSNFSEEKVCTWFEGLVLAIEYLHGRNLIHRDVKLQNIFLASDGSVRLGDFGLCCRKDSKQSRGIAGTDAYVAPEVLLTMKVGPSLDIWSLGCVLLELITGKMLSENVDGNLAVMAIQEKDPVTDLLKQSYTFKKAPHLAQIVKEVLISECKERPKATDVNRMIKEITKLSSTPFGSSRKKYRIHEHETCDF